MKAKKYILKHYQRTYRVELPKPDANSAENKNKMVNIVGFEEPKRIPNAKFVQGGFQNKKPDYLDDFKYKEKVDVRDKLKVYLKHGYDEIQMNKQLTTIKRDLHFSAEKVGQTLENFGFLKMEDVKEVNLDELTQPSFHSSDGEDPIPVDKDYIHNEEIMHKKSNLLAGKLQETKEKLEAAKADKKLQKEKIKTQKI